MFALTNSWLYLFVAIFSGVSGTVSMKLSHGLSYLRPTLCLIVFYVISFAALTIAVQGVEISVAYALWSGIGTILVAVIGVLHFQEHLSVKKIISLLLIVLGVIGINLANVLS